MGFKELARYINSYSDNMVRNLGPIKVYSLAMEVLKSEKLVDKFMLSEGGFSFHELKRVKQKRSNYKKN